VDDPSDRVSSGGVLVPDQGIGKPIALPALFGFTFVHWRPPSWKRGNRPTLGDLNLNYISNIAAPLSRADSVLSLTDEQHLRSSAVT
jgi:hypothetical protein